MAHSNCSCNQRRAAVNRVLGLTPKPTDKGLRRLRQTAKRIKYLLPKTRTAPWGEMAKCYSGAKRAKYERAAAKRLMTGDMRKYSNVRLFVKFELKDPLDQDGVSKKPNPDPRAIQFRAAEYCVDIARFLKPMEHFLYELKGNGKILPPGRVIGKGLSQRGRACLLAKKWQRFVSPIAVIIDASRFDKHVSRELLQLEHSIYEWMNSDPHFAKLLREQLKNTVYGSHGFKYRTNGRRMSGDMNTALGNCVIMVIMVATVLGKYAKWDMIDDGDDCVLLIERSDYDDLMDRIEDEFLEFGFKIKVESVADELEHVDWCQSRPVQVDEGDYQFVRNYRKVFSNTLGGTKFNCVSEKFRRRHVATIGKAELILNLGVPVLQEYALALIRNAGADPMVLTQDQGLFYRVKYELRERDGKWVDKINPKPIKDSARLSFWRAYGVTPMAQRRMEERLKTWTFQFTGDVEQPYSRDGEWRGIPLPFELSPSG